MSVESAKRIEGYRQTINGEDVMIIDGMLLVRSATRPRWYEITGKDCGCEAAEHGTECHHVRNLRGSVPIIE